MIKLNFDKKEFLHKDSTTVYMATGVLNLEDVKDYLYNAQDLLHDVYGNSVKLEGTNVVFKISAKTKCHVEDQEQYDETVGEHIAESKGKRKGYEKASRILNILSLSCIKAGSRMLRAKSDLATYASTENLHVMTLVQ